VWLVLVLLSINAEAEPIDIIGTGIVSRRAVPSLIWVRIIICVKHPFDVCRAACANTIDHVAVGSPEGFRAFPIVVLFVPFGAAVVSSRPGEPCPIHFNAEYHDQWMAKRSGGISPLIDVCIPLAGEDLVQTELIRPAILFIWLVPGRPEHQWQRAVPPNDIEIVGGKILFSPIT